MGTEYVKRERMDAIRDGIKSGELIGMPVFAYVHSGATIRAAETNPFNCPWDSGQSGFVYCTREAAKAAAGSARLTGRIKAQALAALVAQVEAFDGELN
nr:hypothetical protein WG33_0134 [uncultured bacterium]